MQESVFECAADVSELDQMFMTLQRLIEPDETASVRIYRLCADCWHQAIGIGRTVASEDTACTVI